jgi:hypothetical protein
LKADGEHKQDQAKFLHEFQRGVIHRFAKVPSQDAGKQHAGSPQADAAHFQAPNGHARHAHQGEDADRVRNRLRRVHLEEPLHTASKTSPQTREM